MNKNTLIAIVLIAAIGGVFLVLNLTREGSKPLFGGAPQGMAVEVATTSVRTSTTTPFIVFATTTNCVSRIITTGQDTSLNFTVAEQLTQSPGINFGHFQATGTTVVYDSGLYGCGYWIGSTTVGNGKVTVTEFRSFR